MAISKDHRVPKDKFAPIKIPRTELNQKIMAWRSSEIPSPKCAVLVLPISFASGNNCFYVVVFITWKLMQLRDLVLFLISHSVIRFDYYNASTATLSR